MLGLHLFGRRIRHHLSSLNAHLQQPQQKGVIAKCAHETEVSSGTDNHEWRLSMSVVCCFVQYMATLIGTIGMYITTAASV